MNILIIENDLTIARMEKDYLELSSFKVDIETDGLKGEKLAMSGEYDMLILEVDLPGRGGFEICRKYREIYLKPVIFVSSKEEDIDIIHGFSLGADDYIRKPFRPSELVARVKAHLTRYEALVRYQSALAEPKRDIIICGSLKIDRTSRRVFVDEEEKKLTSKEFSLLFFLATHPNRVFSKEELFHQIWGYSPGGDTATLVVHIRKVREKIEKDTANPEFIQTVWGEPAIDSAIKTENFAKDKMNLHVHNKVASENSGCLIMKGEIEMKVKYVKLAGIILLIFLSFRFLLPLVLPFVLAYFFAKMVSPIIQFLEKKLHWRHKVSVLMVVFIVFIALVSFIGYIISIAVSQTILLLQKLPVYQQMINQFLENMCCQCDKVLELGGGTSYRYVEQQVQNLYHTIGTEVLPRMSGYVTQILCKVFAIASTVFIFIISAVLILLDETFPKIRGKLRPFAGRLRKAGLAYIKSQSIILFIIATVISVGLLLMGNDYAIILGAGIAVFDAFPVVGSGVILIPWAIIKMLGGNYYAAAILITIFAIAAFLREVLEPKLFGKELGLKPLYILISVYVGAELLGLAGVLLGPVGLTILKAAEEEIE